MNAYELANELERIGCTTYCRCEETIPMLRQQADRIAELEKENTDLRYLIATKLEQQDGISLNSMAHPELVGAPTKNVFNSVINPDSLETIEIEVPQTKPLSDEEIQEIYRKVEQDFALTESKNQKGEWRNFPVELVRAIEERIRNA